MLKLVLTCVHVLSCGLMRCICFECVCLCLLGGSLLVAFACVLCGVVCFACCCLLVHVFVCVCLCSCAFDCKRWRLCVNVFSVSVC